MAFASRDRRRALCCAAAIAGVAAAAPGARAEPPRQSRDDAWWTGPLLAPGAGTLPHGHFLIEPYVFDAIAHDRFDGRGDRQPVPRAQSLGSQTYLLYGVTDAVTMGVLPRLGFNRPATGRSSSRVGLGDVGLLAQVGLTRFEEGRWIPSTSLVVNETFPTGVYDRLGDRPANGFGAGAYTTSVSLYSQYLFWLPTGRILRTRLDLTYAISSSPSVHGTSVYGTPEGFAGHAHPGNSFVAIAAAEYSVTRHWVLALDVAYQHDATTRVDGVTAQRAGDVLSTTPIALDAGASQTLSLAPALEYNVTSRIGVIAGAKLVVAGRNAAAAIIPVAAINLVI